MIICEILQLYFQNLSEEEKKTTANKNEWNKNKMCNPITSACICIGQVSSFLLRWMVFVAMWRQQTYGKRHQDDYLHRWNDWLPIHKWIKCKHEHNEVSANLMPKRNAKMCKHGLAKWKNKFAEKTQSTPIRMANGTKSFFFRVFGQVFKISWMPNICARAKPKSNITQNHKHSLFRYTSAFLNGARGANKVQVENISTITPNE